MQGPFQRGHLQHSQSRGSREPQSAPQPALTAPVTLQHPGIGAAGTNTTNLLQTRPATPASSRPLYHPRSPALPPQKLQGGCGSRDRSPAPLLALFPARQWRPPPPLRPGTGSPFSSPGAFPSEWPKRPRAPTMALPAAKPGAGPHRAKPLRAGEPGLGTEGPARRRPRGARRTHEPPPCHGGRPRGGETPRHSPRTCFVPGPRAPAAAGGPTPAGCWGARHRQGGCPARRVRGCRVRGCRQQPTLLSPVPGPGQPVSLLVFCPTCDSEAGPAPSSFH